MKYNSYFFIFMWFPTFLFAQSEKALLTLRTEPEYFSPNNDGLQDQVFFYPVLQAPSETKKWRLDIEDSQGKRVTRFSGNQLPALIKWDGFGKKGVPVPDGTYVALLSAGGEGFHLATRYQIYADTKPPEVTLTVSTPVLDSTFIKQGPLRFFPRAMDSAPVDRWQVQVIDASGRTLHVYWSSGPLSEVSWNGVDRATGAMAPPGIYRTAFVAWDMAGNESAPAFGDVEVKFTVREMLQKTLSQIQIIETPIGLLVQFQSDVLFEAMNKKLILSEGGKKLLRELAILINAYPEAPVTIEGYSKTKKGSAFDKDQASFYGWNIYSNLVKSGNVKASRLSVRGRGRSALFSRRGVAVPFIRNGAEVLLEGNREW